MKASVIKTGKTNKIKLGDFVLEKIELKNSENLVLEKDQLTVKPIRTPRKNWEWHFKKMHENGDDILLIDESFDDENHEEKTEVKTSYQII